MRICDAIDSSIWAIDEDWLHRIRAIALGEGEGPEAVAARLGRPLQNAQTAVERDGVAVIPIVGPIFRYANLFTEVSGATSIEILARDLRAALDNPAVNAILLEVNSPGGQVDGINEAANMIRTAEKPIVAYVSGLGASGAYWLAAAADEVVIDATAQLGSIGVVMGVERKSRDGKLVELVSSQSPNKRPDVTTEEGRASLQARIDAIADVFVDAVAEFRSVSRETVLTEFGGGGVKVGSQAIAARMADRAGSHETTLALLAGGYRKRRRMMAGPKTEEEIKGLIDAARGEGRTAGIEEGKKLAAEDGRKVGYDEGVKAERERLLGIDRATMPGHEKLALEAKQAGTSAAEFALQQVEAEKVTRERQLGAIQRDGEKTKVAPAATATGEQPSAASDASLPIEERCKAQWEKDPQIREEFGKFERFLAYSKAEAAGRVRHIRRAG